MRTLDLRFPAWRWNGHRSWWIEQTLADEPEGAPPLRGDQRVDVCIVGGGFSGLWTAIRLLERAPGTCVAIVEAERCGAGASGRNSGAMGHWWSKLPTLLHLLGADDAKLVLRRSVEIVGEIRQFITERQIRCELRSTPSVWSETSPGRSGAWRAMLEAAEQMGVEPPYRRLSAEELRQMFGGGPYYAGLIEEDATRVQPASLARGLMQVAIQLGAAVYERSPVSRIETAPAAITVATDQGVIRAQKVVLAANAWMAHLPAFIKAINVVSSDMVITGPIPDLLDRLGMRNRPGGVNSQLMLNYGGFTPEGRVYMGRGGGTISFGNRVTQAFDYSPARSAEVEQDFRYLYPELREVPVARRWAGPIDRSASGLPWFGALPEDARVLYAIGYSGHGVAATAIAGHVLASALLEQHDHWHALGDCLLRARRGRFPPEPIRSVAAHVIRGSVARKERAERAGRKPSFVDARLASLALASVPDRFVN